MIAQTTCNYSGITLKQIQESTHDPVEDHDRWSLVIPTEVPSRKPRKQDLIELVTLAPSMEGHTMKHKAYARPRFDLDNWLRDRLADEWDEILQQNFWEMTTKDRIASKVGMNTAWEKLKTQMADRNKWKEHRNENGNLYIYQQNWLFLKELRRYSNNLPFRIGCMEGKGRATALSQVCLGRYFEAATGTAQNDTLLCGDYYCLHKIIDKSEIPEGFSFRDHLDELMKGSFTIDAVHKLSTLNFISITSHTCNLNSKMISTNKIDSNRPSPLDTIGNDFLRPLALSIDEDKYMYEPDFTKEHEPEPDFWKWREPASTKQDKDNGGKTEHERYNTPKIHDSHELSDYYNDPFDHAAEKCLKHRLSTIARKPTYNETPEMEEKRTSY